MEYERRRRRRGKGGRGSDEEIQKDKVHAIEAVPDGKIENEPRALLDCASSGRDTPCLIRGASDLFTTVQTSKTRQATTVLTVLAHAPQKHPSDRHGINMRCLLLSFLPLKKHPFFCLFFSSFLFFLPSTSFYSLFSLPPIPLLPSSSSLFPFFFCLSFISIPHLPFISRPFAVHKKNSSLLPLVLSLLARRSQP